MKRQVVIPLQGDGAKENALSGSVSDPLPDILEIKKARQLSQRLVVGSHTHIVCRFWLEKALVLVETVQLYALLWQLSQPWPWPSRWLRWTRWTNAANLDVFSFRATGAAMGATSQSFSLWGEMHRYWLDALAWSVTPWLCIVILWVFSKKWEKQRRMDFLVRRIWWENALLQILQVLYVPIGLAVLRLVNCDSNGAVSVDPTTFPTCWSLAHTLAVVAITCALGGVFLVGLPLVLRHRINKAIVTNDQDEHARFMKSTEMAYILNTSHSYVELYMPQFASYERHAVQTPVESCVLKLVLLATFSLLRSSPPSTFYQGLQGSVFFVVFGTMAWKRTWRQPFRVASTNQLAKVASWLLVANGSMALLCANGVRSALTVATSVTSSLTFVNGSLCSIAMLSLATSMKQWKRRHELVPVARNKIQAVQPCWPTHPLMNEIIHHSGRLEKWVTLLQRASVLSLKTAIAAPTMKPFHELGLLLEELNESWNEASGLGHPLTAQLYQELMYISDLYVDALACSPFKEESRPDHDEEAFVAFTERLKHRDDKQRLLTAPQRRVLSKLHVASIWAIQSEAHPLSAAEVDGADQQPTQTMGIRSDEELIHEARSLSPQALQELLKLTDSPSQN